ncbi:MAG: ribulose-phosphate 3-epimerase [Bacteroidetes bacterium HGW-Bacteroidetes-6]|jgi:ribulose-phosphate 3-epimerase|nr:MAG: ribulose-phosphate 3-epimerase [Bacteroidetes bacterium HGW-Bacteroidetes-6]
MSVLIAPSILSADFLNLGKDIEMLNNSDADWIHVDVMDGMFVPNISFGFPVIEAVASVAKKPLDIHLMIEKPERFIQQFVKAGASYLSFHYEGAVHLHRTVQMVKETGTKCGVVLNPHTSVGVLLDILPDLDFVLLMSVNPGYGGQKFIPGSLRKIEAMRKLRDSLNPDCLIEVDGGINEANAADVVAAGADVLVAGNAVFKSANPLDAIIKLKA